MSFFTDGVTEYILLLIAPAEAGVGIIVPPAAAKQVIANIPAVICLNFFN